MIFKKIQGQSGKLFVKEQAYDQLCKNNHMKDTSNLTSNFQYKHENNHVQVGVLANTSKTGSTLIDIKMTCFQ